MFFFNVLFLTLEKSRKHWNPVVKLGQCSLDLAADLYTATFFCFLQFKLPLSVQAEFFSSFQRVPRNRPEPKHKQIV